MNNMTVLIDALIMADCKDYLSVIESSSIDLICIDPPYGIDYSPYDMGILNWNNLNYDFFRILKDTGNLIIFQGWSNIDKTRFIFEDNFLLKNCIAWDRIKGRGAKRNFVSTREDILWFTKTDKYTFNKIYSGGFGKKNGEVNRALSNVWSDLSPIVPWSKEYNGYPGQKPVKLIERILKIFSNENDLVLDCFGGSGTIIEACKNLDRHFIYIDKSSEAFEIASKR